MTIGRTHVWAVVLGCLSVGHALGRPNLAALRQRVVAIAEKVGSESSAEAAKAYWAKLEPLADALAEIGRDMQTRSVLLARYTFIEYADRLAGQFPDGPAARLALRALVRELGHAGASGSQFSVAEAYVAALARQPAAPEVRLALTSFVRGEAASLGAPAVSSLRLVYAHKLGEHVAAGDLLTAAEAFFEDGDYDTARMVSDSALHGGGTAEAARARYMVLRSEWYVWRLSLTGPPPYDRDYKLRSTYVADVKRYQNLRLAAPAALETMRFRYAALLNAYGDADWAAGARREAQDLDRLAHQLEQVR